MDMPEFHLTEKKLEEYLGEPYLGYFNPLKSRRARWLLVLPFFFILIIPLLILSQHPWFILGAVFGIVFLEILSSFNIKEQFRYEIALKMKELVNDPQLLWLNAPQPKIFEEISGKPIHWGRTTKGELAPESFKALAYLKKEGTSSGLYKKVVKWKNSNSANTHLRRLAKKGIVEYKNNDFHYVGWRFVPVDEKNQPLQTERARKTEELLLRCWNLMLEREGELLFER